MSAVEPHDMKPFVGDEGHPPCNESAFIYKELVEVSGTDG
jgi:hypothetical protein